MQKCMECNRRYPGCEIKLAGHNLIGLIDYKVIASRYICEDCAMQLKRTSATEVFQDNPQKITDPETIFLLGFDEFFLGTVVKYALPKVFDDFGDMTTLEGYANQFSSKYPEFKQFIENKLAAASNNKAAESSVGTTA